MVIEKNDHTAIFNFENVYDTFPALLHKVQCGVSFPDDWAKILYQVFLAFDEHNSSFSPESPEYIVIGQVKEKFGGLRIYINNGHSPIVDAIINLATSVCYWKDKANNVRQYGY